MSKNNEKALGFYTGQVDNKTIVNFLIKHEKSLAGTVDVTSDLKHTKCLISGNEGTHAIIANTIFLETGIRFEYYPNDSMQTRAIICRTEIDENSKTNVMPYILELGLEPQLIEIDTKNAGL